MGFPGLILLCGVVAFTACGGETRSAATMGDSPVDSTPVGGFADHAGPVAHAPITGRVHEVRMMGDGLGYRFEPRTIRARPGDGVRFVMHSLGPHNIVFDSAAVPADQKAQLYANMPGSEAGTSPMLTDEEAAWELSLGKLRPGTYPFFCSPHLGANMSGEIIIQ